MRVFPAAAAASLLPLLLLAAPAEARPARCAVQDATGHDYRGPCDFLVERGGSFTVTTVKGRFLVPGVTSLSLTIVKPGLGEVRGMTALGVNSRWGEARRSRKDRACWDGADFRLCVY
ncbi:hypothetical protein E2493_10320 [Sphingomonas parva]|uniref:Uncharacterized protein n=1 Tax=Sphingomonas parva TaxID=2555898 RepID=A0A4Y8ZUE2_9SPHN|nr:hypothetical protein [Sphingomonas parva]TFI58369.1 hypothetical protein E2493_10320 [Sphingomonas parva]